MQKKTILSWTFLMSVLFAASVSLSFAKDMPAPGTVIDKNNYQQYSHLFPEEWAPAFGNGFEGLMPEYKLKVAQTQSYPMPKVFLDYSAKNKGKYAINADGKLTPAFDREGLPFPDLKPGDPDFATKLMWNFDSKYWCDEALDTGKGGSYEKRRGEKVRVNQATSFWLFFKNRMVLDPKPDLENPQGLYKVLLFHYLKPNSVKNTITLSYRYVDDSKPDDTYLYLPSMRRVIRAEAGQRSTPVLGSTQALDDFVVFDGRIPDFTYTLVGEQKVLSVADSMSQLSKVSKKNLEHFPVEYENYQARDVYVIDAVPKDPKYPQSKKRIYIDKETLWACYGIAWDRAGKLWKMWHQATRMYDMPDGKDRFAYTISMIGLDLQFGMSTQYVADNIVNSENFSYSDVTPQALLKRAR